LGCIKRVLEGVHSGTERTTGDFDILIYWRFVFAKKISFKSYCFLSKTRKESRV